MSAEPSGPPSFREALRFWLKLGFISFGGPAGQIALMHHEVVERRRWISESRFLHALNFCHLLPGPEAQQLATYIGWLLHGARGGIAAGALFVLPSAVLLWLISLAYVTWGRLPAVQAVFAGVQPAVLALVAAAVLRIGRKALRTPASRVLAVLSFLALLVFQTPFPVVVALAAVIGLAGDRLAPRFFRAPAKPSKAAQASPAEDGAEDAGNGIEPSWGRTARVASLCLSLWWAPVLLLATTLGREHILVHQGIFFSKAAMVTFGGAYAVLPYVSQQAVQGFGWLEPGQMLDGLAFAESTPGPLIMVLQFVGFLGAWRFPEPFSPLVAATLGAAITTWTTFLPCFLWIFLGAPHVERLRERPALSAGLAAVSAAVVGVVLHLAVWFGLHTLAPEGQPFRVVESVVALLALLALTRLRMNLLLVLGLAALVGLARHLLGWG